MPVPAGPITDKPISWDWEQWAMRVDQVAMAARNRGTTANRPTAKDAYIGMFYLDETLGYPIWAEAISPTVVTWINSAGTTV